MKSIGDRNERLKVVTSSFRKYRLNNSRKFVCFDTFFAVFQAFNSLPCLESFGQFYYPFLSHVEMSLKFWRNAWVTFLDLGLDGVGH